MRKLQSAIVNKSYHYISQRKYLLVLPLLSLLILYLHYVNFLTFSFADEYNSYVRAYFMEQGRGLYSEIFSHHNPLMVYFSYALQQIIPVNSIYELVLAHRMSIAVYSLVMASLLILRFKWPAVGFVFVIEIVKYYLFGNLFLAESLVMYLLVFLLGIAWEKLHAKKLSTTDLLLSGLSVFLITFLREPLIPPAVVLFAYILFDKSRLKLKAGIITLLAILSLLVVLSVDFSEYYYHLITLNFSGYIQEELESKGTDGLGILKTFLYPIYIFISGKVGDFRWILVCLDIIFISSLVILIKQKKYQVVGLLLLVLGLANIRYSVPGETFFGAFHMFPWFGMFVFSIFLMVNKMKGLLIYPYMRLALVCICAIVIMIALLPPYPVANRPLSKSDEYSVNYSRFFIHGEVVRRLSNPDDTLFVDYWDTLVFWQAGLDSAYQYAMFFPVMDSIDKYTEPRTEMFRNDPPDFYYYDCNSPNPSMNYDVLTMYRALLYQGETTCLYVHKSKLPEISDEQWQSIEGLEYSLSQE